jgi:hypothetical protein
MSLHSIVLAAWLLGLSFLIIPHSAFGQTSDSAPPTSSDSAPASDSLARDTLAGGTPPGAADTTRTGAETVRDSLAVASDTARPPQPRDTANSEAAGVSTPGDSVLRRSCQDRVGTGVARGLLVVVFAPEAGAEERATAAESVEGKLVGSVPGDPGAHYLRVAGEGGEHRLRAAADQLIQLPQVRQVGSRSCPPPQPRAPAHQRP